MTIFNYFGWQTFSKIFPLSLIFLAATVSTSVRAETSTLFSKEVLEFNKRITNPNTDWLTRESPWFPYLRRQNEEGLSPTEHKKYLIYQDQARCDELAELEVAGFSELHPELAETMQGKLVISIFVQKIIPVQSFGYRRCKALALLNPIIEAEKKLDPVGYAMMIPGTNLSTTSKKIYDPREVILRKAFKVLFDLAACHDYKSAIKDIIAYHKLRLNFVGNEEILYFRNRAKRHGIDTAGFYPIPTDIPIYRPSTRPLRLRAALARNDLIEARELIFFLTYISCGRGMNE